MEKEKSHILYHKAQNLTTQDQYSYNLKNRKENSPTTFHFYLHLNVGLGDFQTITDLM